jgi:DNA-binding CsgD family transcriptional regulator
MSLVYSFQRWCIVGIGGAAVVCVLLLNKLPLDNKSAQITNIASQGSQPIKTNWTLIFHLIGITTVVRILNAIMDFRLFPLMNYATLGEFYPFYIMLGLAIPAIALFAGRSTDRFIKLFLPPAIAMFILLTCLPLFVNYPNFILFMNSLTGLFNNLIWVFFTAAIVEAYTGSFWFYFLATAILLTNHFTFIAHRFNRYLPPISTEFTVLLAGLAAVIFFFLSYRIISPKPPKNTLEIPAFSDSIPLEEILRNHNLTDKEIEVAALMVKEGLNSTEIANRVFRAEITVKTHITSIYRKFGVRNRTEFMALFVKR